MVMAARHGIPGAGLGRAIPGGWPRWRRLALAGVALAALALPLWNVLADPFGVFGAPWPVQSRSTNERYLKVGHLLRHPARHDAFVVGSSLMGAVEPSAVGRRLGIADGRFYNLSFFAARPGEILDVLKALDARGVAIRHIVYGLEPVAFSDPKRYGPSQTHHPAVSGKPWRAFWAESLWAAGVAAGLDRLGDSLRNDPFIRFDIEGGGRYVLVRLDREIEADPGGFASKMQFGQTSPLVATPWVDSRFADFARLMGWLRDKRADARVYLNPLHSRLAAAYGEARLREFEARLVAAGRLESLPDCTRLLDGDAGWAFYDVKHFRPAMAGRVLDCGLGQGRGGLPAH
jgi:hypothetical protein